MVIISFVGPFGLLYNVHNAILLDNNNKHYNTNDPTIIICIIMRFEVRLT